METIILNLVNIYYQVANALSSCNDEIRSKTYNKKNINKKW